MKIKLIKTKNEIQIISFKTKKKLAGLAINTVVGFSNKKIEESAKCLLANMGGLDQVEIKAIKISWE